jgi:hypothetical protein
MSMHFIELPQASHTLIFRKHIQAFKLGEGLVISELGGRLNN